MRSPQPAPVLGPPDTTWPGELCVDLVAGVPTLLFHYAACMEGKACSASVQGAEVRLTTRDSGRIHDFCRSAWAEVARCPLEPPLSLGHHRIVVNGLAPALEVDLSAARPHQCWSRPH